MHTSFFVQNIKCGGCAKTITDKLASMADIEKVKVDVENGEVHFEHGENIDTETVKQTLAHMGYPLVDASNGVITKAKSYVSCAVGRMSK